MVVSMAAETRRVGYREYVIALVAAHKIDQAWFKQDRIMYYFYRTSETQLLRVVLAAL